MRRKTNPFGEGMTGRRKMENEVRIYKGMIPEMDQLPRVSWSRTDKRSEYEALKKLKDHASGEENEALSSCSLNIWKGEEERDFSPGKFCKCLLVRGTTLFCKGNCKFVYRREWKVECISATQWIMLKRNYFVFSCVSFTVRVFNVLNLCSC